jgi:hypothetical protein
MFELSGTDMPSRRECVSRAGYQQGRSQPSSLVRGDGGGQQSHNFGGYSIEVGELHDGAWSGRRIMITLGLSVGWTRTTSMVSPDWLIAPLVRGVVDDGTRRNSPSV